MIIEYHRPKDESQALALLNRKIPITIPLGGGTVVSKTSQEVAVVDLQFLDLNYIREENKTIAIGSMTTLEEMLSYFGKESAIGQAIVIDAGKNIRCMATLGGSVVSNGGRSALLTVLKALGIEIVWKPGDKVTDIDTWLASKDAGRFGDFISEIRMPKEVQVAFESVGRSPLDLPIICCAVTRQPNGSLRLALGGFGEAPILGYEGNAWGDVAKSVGGALNAAGDEWASAEYRVEAGTILAKRLIEALAEGK